MLGNLTYVQFLVLALMEKTWLRPQWNTPSWFAAQMDRTWFYERLFFEAVIVMVKDNQFQCQSKLVLWITWSWTTVMLRNLNWFIFFCYFFSFHYHCQLVKGQFWQKYGGLQPRQPPWFLQDCYQVNTAILGNKSVLKIVNIGSPNINN